MVLDPRSKEHPQPPRPDSAVFRDCLARQIGACRGLPACLECDPVHQALCAAGWVSQRWPRIEVRAPR
jgi:hypothetical protein